jgi:hypothetical protein
MYNQANETTHARSPDRLLFRLWAGSARGRPAPGQSQGPGPAFRDPGPHCRLSTGSRGGSDGTFVLRGVLPGSYSVRPQSQRYHFTPAFRTVAVTTQDAQSVNFTAHAVEPKKK